MGTISKGIFALAAALALGAAPALAQVDKQKTVKSKSGKAGQAEQKASIQGAKQAPQPQPKAKPQAARQSPSQAPQKKSGIQGAPAAKQKGSAALK